MPFITLIYICLFILVSLTHPLEDSLVDDSNERAHLLRNPRTQRCRMAQERAVSTVKRLNIPVDSTCFNHHLLCSKRDCFVSETVQIRPSAVEHGVSPGWMRARGIHGRIRLKAQLTYCYRAVLRRHVFVENCFRISRKYLSVRLGQILAQLLSIWKRRD